MMTYSNPCFSTEGGSAGKNIVSQLMLTGKQKVICPSGGLSLRVLVTSRQVQADEVLLSQKPVGSLEFGFVVPGAGWTEL